MKLATSSPQLSDAELKDTMATELSSTKVAGGTLRRVKHASAATATDMVFAIFTPGVGRVPPVRRDLLVRGTAAASAYASAFDRLAQR